ncbi:Agamous-like MADS-box protein AGL62 [Striga hermonthica]|uniref:Agamous-like MADS-box protein AGL62 n=1 Tax=Striga hermonthica TaxID=68872 RepID=A0A9N7RD20_STRHE|nr:Agamous-like MADS-box protein AGL62 [Striga hermonthica]
MVPPQGRKKAQGRRKIDIKLIEDENARTVTFSKRRAGIFKKAAELSILCGTEIAIIIFSHSGRAYSYGHPSVESVAGRFFNRNPLPNLHGPNNDELAHLKEECERRAQVLEVQKRRAKELEAELERLGLTDEQLGQLDSDHLQDIKEKMVKLRDSMLRRQVQDEAGPSGMGTIAAADGTTVFVAAGNYIDLEKEEREEREWCGDSGIPADWLKL